RHAGQWPLRSGSHASDEPRHHRLWRCGQHSRQSPAVDSESRRDQAWRPHASDGAWRAPVGGRPRLPGDASLSAWNANMATESLTFPRALPISRPLVDRLHEWVTTVDHKRLGILYIGYALVFLCIGGIEATIMRVQLMVPHNDLVSPQVFNRLFTMHGTTMIFFVAMPIVFGFANYMLPLMLGARDMAFPRLNAFSFWLTAFGGLLLYFSLLGASGLYGAGNAP